MYDKITAAMMGDREAQEYRTKHKRCDYCIHSHYTPCGCLVCAISDRCTMRLRAVVCQYYNLPKRRNKHE